MLLRINYAILVTSHCFLVASYIQGKITKNTVNRVRLGPLVVENFCRQIENIHRVLDRFNFSFPSPSKHLHVGYVQFGQNRRKIPNQGWRVLAFARFYRGDGGFGVPLYSVEIQGAVGNRFTLPSL